MDIEIKNTTEILQDYLNYIQDEVKIKKTPLGFEKIDKLLNGGLPNGLITLGAIPSLGKTTFMLQVADNMASLDNTKVLFFSLEMSRYNLISKSLSRLTYLNENLQDLTYDELEKALLKEIKKMCRKYLKTNNLETLLKNNDKTLKMQYNLEMKKLRIENEIKV